MYQDLETANRDLEKKVEMVKVGIYISKEEYDTIKKYAKDKDISFSKGTRRLLQQGLINNYYLGKFELTEKEQEEAFGPKTEFGLFEMELREGWEAAISKQREAFGRKAFKFERE